MGIGTYYVNPECGQAVTVVYLSHASEYESLEHDDFAFSDALDEIKAHLSPAFKWAHDGWTRCGNHRILAQSSLLSVEYTTHGDDIGLRVVIRDDVQMTGFSRNAAHAAARRLFNKLADVLELRQRTSGWTSAPYVKQ